MLNKREQNQIVIVLLKKPLMYQSKVPKLVISNSKDINSNKVYPEIISRKVTAKLLLVALWKNRKALMTLNKEYSEISPI